MPRKKSPVVVSTAMVNTVSSVENLGRLRLNPQPKQII